MAITKATAIAYLKRYRPRSVISFETASNLIRGWARRNKLTIKTSGLYSMCYLGKDFVIKIPRVCLRGSDPSSKRSWSSIYVAMQVDRKLRTRFLKNKILAKYIPQTVYVNTIFAVQERADICRARFGDAAVSTLRTRFEHIGIDDIHDDNVGFRKDGSPVLIDLYSDQLAENGATRQLNRITYRMHNHSLPKSYIDSRSAFEEDVDLYGRDSYEDSYGYW